MEEVKQSAPVSPIPDKMHSSFDSHHSKLIPIIIAITVFTLIGVGSYVLGTKKSQPVVEKVVSQPSPTPTPYVDNSRLDPWQNYVSGQNVDGITINYPTGWQVNYRKEYNLSSDYTAKYRISFDFTPPGWQGLWGSLSFDVYDHKANTTQYINDIYPSYKNKLIATPTTEISNKPTFLFEGKDNFYWASRHIILGSKYSYELEHSQNGSDDFVKDVKSKSGIYTYIDIE